MPQGEPLPRRHQPRPCGTVDCLMDAGFHASETPNATVRSRRQSRRRVHYLESDDEPMGESFLHIDVSSKMRTLLLVPLADRPDASVGATISFATRRETQGRR